MSGTNIQVGIKPARELFVAVADAVASTDMEQTEREAVAEALGEALSTTRLGPHFREYRETFVLLASDPLVPCAGYDLHDDGEHVPCPHERVIRIAMHNRDEPLGRSRAWKPRAPYGEIRCVTCGAMQFSPGYQANVLRAGR